MPRPASRHKSDFGASAWSDEEPFMGQNDSDMGRITSFAPAARS